MVSIVCEGFVHLLNLAAHCFKRYKSQQRPNMRSVLICGFLFTLMSITMCSTAGS